MIVSIKGQKLFFKRLDYYFCSSTFNYFSVTSTYLSIWLVQLTLQYNALYNNPIILRKGDDVRLSFIPETITILVMFRKLLFRCVLSIKHPSRNSHCVVHTISLSAVKHFRNVIACTFPVTHRRISNQFYYYTRRLRRPADPPFVL